MRFDWLTKPGFKLDPDVRRKAVRLFAFAGLLFALLVGVWLSLKAGHLHSKSPLDAVETEHGFQALINLHRMVTGIALGPVVVGLSVVQYWFLHRTEIGRMLTHWALGDPAAPTNEDLVRAIQEKASSTDGGITLHQVVGVVRGSVQAVHEDPEGVPAAKTKVSGLLFCTLLVINTLLILGSSR